MIERGYEISGNIADMAGEGNIYFYLGWGNFTYAHMALFSRDVCEKFTDALIEFSADEGELEIKGEIIILNFNR